MPSARLSLIVVLASLCVAVACMQQSPSQPTPASSGAGGSTSPSFTFTEPGRYLVICTFLPHFADAQMYGWVIVK